MFNIFSKVTGIFIILLTFYSFAFSQTAGPDGSFNYTIDIILPPGTVGLAPQLSVVYNSNSGNGILGKGFSLAGLPCITRDNTYAINYDGTDHYIGEGGRLVHRASPFSSSYYYYEDEGLSYLVKTGGQGGVTDEPQSWIEGRTDGTRYSYGTTNDSRIIANDHAPLARAWALSKVEDFNGNYYTIEYIQDNGEFYPERITYTYGSGVSRYRTVEFEYEPRSDAYTDYSFSTGVMTGMRLKTITIKTGVMNILGFRFFGNLAREYRFDYVEGDITGHSYLSSVHEIGSNGGQLPPVKFEWDSEADYSLNDPYNPLDTPIANLPLSDFSDSIGDVNGDGLMDFISSTDSTTYVWLANNLESKFNSCFASSFLSGPKQIMDVNGDGLDDVIFYNGGTIYYSGGTAVSLSNGSSFAPTIINPQNFGGYVVDADGDGRADIMGFTTYSMCASLYKDGGFAQLTGWLAKAYTQYLISFACSNIIVAYLLYQLIDEIFSLFDLGYLFADVNGDGKTDYVSFEATGVYVYLSKGYGFLPATKWSTDFLTSAYDLKDVNDDGKADIVSLEGSEIWVYLSTGSGFTAKQLWHSDNYYYTSLAYYYAQGGTVSKPQWTMAELNGDGKADLVVVGPDGSENAIHVYLSTGSSFIEKTFTRYPQIEQKLLAGDINGDGNDEIIFPWRLSGQSGVRIYSSEPSWPLIRKVNTSSGGKININYEVTTKKNGCIVPKAGGYPYIANKSVRKIVNQISFEDGRTSVTDGGVHSYTTSYEYRNGMIYMGFPYERKDLGFETVKRINNNTGAYTITTYRQDNPDFHNIPLMIVEYTGDNVITKKTEFEYSGGVCMYFIRPTKTTTSFYEAGILFSQEINDFTYDFYGNITKAVNNATGVDEVTTENTYFSTFYGLLSECKKTSCSSVLQDTKFSYDTTYYGNFSGYRLISVERYLNTSNIWIKTYFDYYTIGNLQKISDSNGWRQLITYESDYRAFISKIESFNGQTTQNIQRIYDPATGCLLSSINPNGFETTYTYDEFGRPTQSMEPGDEWTTRIYYYNTGNPNTQYIETQAKDDNSGSRYRYIRSYFDALGREYRTVSQAESDTSQSVDLIVDRLYNNYGGVYKQSNPYIPNETPVYTTNEYDSLGRLKKRIYPEQSGAVFSTVEYSAESGHMIIKTTDPDPVGNFNESHYDARGRLIVKKEPNATVNYAYDPMGRIIRVIDAGLKTTSIQYDTLGRKLSLTDPNTGTWTYDYDDRDRLTEQTDANGNTKNFEYDNLNRLTQETNSDGTTVSYEYDNRAYSNAIGHLTHVNDGVSECKFSYDEKGNMKVFAQKVDSMEFVFNMEYDPQKRLRYLTYPDGAQFEYKYSNAGHLQTVLNSGDGGAIVQYSRVLEIGNNQLIRRTANGVKTTFNINPVTYRLMSKNSTNDNNVNLENLAYSYDNTGNITGIQDNINTDESQVFQYDELNRLKYAKGVYGEHSFTYAANGNILTKGGLSLYYNNDSTHPYAVTGDSNGNSYSYDANGNMISRKGNTLTYNANNQLTSAQGETFKYDFTGLRVKKTRSDGLVVYNIGGLFELMKDPSGSRPDHYTKYIYGSKGDLVSQITLTGSVLQNSGYYSGMRKLYTYGTPGGFFIRLYYDASAFTENVKNYRYFLMFILCMAIVSVIAFHLYYHVYRRWETGLCFKWMPQVAPLIIIFFFGTFCISGCNKADNNADYFLSSSTILEDSSSLPSVGTYFFHKDHVNSTVMITDSQGNAVSRVRYTPYGEIVNTVSGSDIYKYKYTGQEHDVTTGLYYYKSRYYDPAIGRFIQPDTVIDGTGTTQGWNRYMYVHGDPVNNNDPSGRHMRYTDKDYARKYGIIVSAPREKNWESGSTYDPSQGGGSQLPPGWSPNTYSNIINECNETIAKSSKGSSALGSTISTLDKSGTFFSALKPTPLTQEEKAAKARKEANKSAYIRNQGSMKTVNKISTGGSWVGVGASTGQNIAEGMDFWPEANSAARKLGSTSKIAPSGLLSTSSKVCKVGGLITALISTGLDGFSMMSGQPDAISTKRFIQNTIPTIATFFVPAIGIPLTGINLLFGNEIEEGINACVDLFEDKDGKYIDIIFGGPFTNP